MSDCILLNKCKKVKILIFDFVTQGDVVYTFSFVGFNVFILQQKKNLKFCC